MEKFAKVCSRVFCLDMKDIDTDQIIPARFLTSVSREGYGENLFCDLRKSEDYTHVEWSRIGEAKVLVAGENFGCGSSREHAVWAVQGAGFKVVIAPSFSDIFSANSAKNGLLLVRVCDEIINLIIGEDSFVDNYRLEVDLEREEVVLPGGVRESFSCDPFRKHCLLNGLEDIDYIFSFRGEIEKYRKCREVVRFYSAIKPNYSIT
ncbi:MAG: 3-isopropylmalate dehydratase small subunit [Deltaproteobacteria bacterium]|nr:3-isopropylmalate dehydratase small subunit [Deltaproteobacteria bacterium]